MTLTESSPTETAAEFPPEMYAPGANPASVQAKIPFAMTDRFTVPRERYYSREFFDLENEHLWPHSWLMAARLEEIPNAGDYVEFEIAENSILIVRQRDMSVKALYNACRHRATELAKGCGRFLGGQIVCPFHGWRWNLDGSSSFVFLEDTFDASTMRAEDLRLRECQVDVWAGMVWINMDLAALPLRDELSPVAEVLDSVGVGNMRVKWWKQTILNSNWKIAREAFLEGYHVMQTHPQLLQGGGEQFARRSAGSTVYTAFRGGHGRFQSGAARMSDWGLDDFIEANRLLQQGQDAMALDREVQIFEGIRNKLGADDPNFMQAAVGALYDYAAGAGIPMMPPSPHLKWGGVVYLFPNVFILPMYANALAYRIRPYGNDPERCLFDVWSLTTYPEGQEPERAELAGVFEPTDAAQWGLIPRQDFSNIERQQRGVHSRSYEHHRLSTQLERLIVNAHEQLDRVLAAGLD